jgi:hypothetical protein
MKTPSASIAARCAALLAMLLACTFAAAQQDAAVDPPARVGALTAIEGSVVFAPPGETEWSDATLNRPLTRGDRLWTDEGGRAEVHFGSSVLHMDSGTFVEIIAVDGDLVQLQLNEGTANARVRELAGGENFEIDTPNLAFRATQPGDWRIDVDPQRGITRIAMHSGAGVVYGAGGGAQQVVAGQAVAFIGRDLAQLAGAPPAAEAFERWAAERNRAEDQSVAARYVPREVVGYQELDRNGTWAQDPSYGVVWYPQVTVADWAPYRYGHWAWVAPWGWTWIDDARWGFAPFHYGRWTMIGTRWCWVPGPLGPRPVYAPALVGFVGGDGAGFSVASGPGIAWYPLAPGEVWRPFFRTSPVYVRNVNRYVVTDSRFYNTGTPRFMYRTDAVTAVRIDDFHRGRPVQQHWSRVSPVEIARVQPITPPAPLRDARRAEAVPNVVRAPQPQPQPQVQQQVQRYAQPLAPATPLRPRREPALRPQPNWRGGEEGGYVRRAE